MRLRSFRRPGGLLLAIVLATVACGSSLPEPFPLDWQGVDSAPSPSDRVRAALSRKTFRIEPTVDRRADVTKVGVDQESHYQYRTSTNVAAFCSDRIKDMATAAGFKLVEQGDFILQSEIAEFNVAEAGLYNGEVRVTFRIFAPGKPAFESVYEGQSKRWGRSHSTDNINEALSNALHGAMEKFLRDDALADALEGKSAAPPAPGAHASPAAPTPAAPAKPVASAKGAYNL
jgi:hypothetical protein